MTKNEKEALLTYLDSQVMSFCKSVKQYVDPDAVGAFYDGAYDMIRDMDEAMSSHIVIQTIAKQPALTSKRKSQ